MVCPIIHGGERIFGLVVGADLSGLLQVDILEAMVSGGGGGAHSGG